MKKIISAILVAVMLLAISVVLIKIDASFAYFMQQYGNVGK